MVFRENIPVEQFLLSDELGFQEKIQRLAEGSVKLDPFSSSREILMFKDFTSDTPAVLLFPKFSFIHDKSFYLGMLNTWKARRMINLHINKP